MTTAVAPAIRRAIDADTYWNWKRFHGSPDAIRYARRDLPHIDAFLQHVLGRTRVVQAGGSLGIFPKYLAQHFEQIITFECDPSNFVALTVNAPEPNIVRFQAVLGAEHGSVGLSRQRRDGKPNAHDGIVHVDGPGQVPVMRLDDLHLDMCNAVLLDVEGYELHALNGARATIMRCRPVISLEVNRHLESYGFTEADVKRFFDANRYTYVAQLGSDRVFVPSERAQ